MPHDILSLLSAHGPRLHALLTRLTLRTDIAEELMQELFLKLSHSAAFHGANDPAAYAFRAAIHLALDNRRRQKFAAQLPSNLIAPTAAPHEQLAGIEQADRLLAALAELSPQAQEAATLHFIQQLSYEEVAHIMENTPHQVRGLCHDALRQLRARFGVSISKEMSHG